MALHKLTLLLLLYICITLTNTIWF